MGVVLLLGPFHLAEGLDKLAHIGGFYAFTALALAALPFNRKADILWAAAAIAGASELAQGLTGRTMSAADLAADLLGVAAAGLPIYVADLRRAAQTRQNAPSSLQAFADHLSRRQDLANRQVRLPNS